MMPRVYILLLIIPFFLPKIFVAQVIATPSDTTICPDTEVFLHAEFDACQLTECYEYEEIPFDWLTDPGTAISLEDNDHAGPFNIGFDFCFFGETYTQFWVCDNGWISFVAPTNAMSNNAYPNTALPDASSSAPKTAVFVSWRDLFPSGGTSVVSYFTTGIAPFRKTYIKFSDMEHPLCIDGIMSLFEIALHEDENYIDNIFFQVELCPGGDDPSIQGLQNQDGTIAYTAPGRNFTEWSALSESSRWKPNQIRWVIDGDTVAYGPDMSFFPATTTDVIAMVIGCDGIIFTDTVHITVPEYFDPVFEVTDNICFGDSEGAINTTFPAGTSGFDLEWSTGETTEDLSGLASGFYILTISDDNGCTNEFSVFVDEPAQLIISPTGIENVGCLGAQDGSITITVFGGVAPYSYSFEGGEFSDVNFFDDLPAGDYDVAVTDANGCTYETTLTVGAGTILSADITGISPIDEGQTTTLTVITDGELGEVIWEPPGLVEPCDTPPCYEYFATLFETTTFYATIIDENGCIVYDTITIEVEQVDHVNIPNAFSPNGDGVNDYFQAVSDHYIEKYQLRIYNRYGQMVYETNSPVYEDGWDGKFEAEDQPISTYTYTIDVNFLNGIKRIQTGNFLLVR